jgi:hypothetical protein
MPHAGIFVKNIGTLVSGQAQPPREPFCRVETYSGYRLHERPRRFTFQGQWLEVRRVLARWQEPEHLAFVVFARDSHSYVLKYHLHRDAWEVSIRDV